MLSAVFGLVARGPLAGIAYAKDALWALGVLILVIGWGSAGSVTGRRPFATIVVILQLAVANPLAERLVSGLIPKDEGNPYAEEDAWAAVYLPYQAVVVVLTVLAVVLIGVVRTVPSPWNWAPAWVLAFSWVIGAVGLGLFSSGSLGTPVSTIGAWAGMIAAVLGEAFLGAVAIVLGTRATTASGVLPPPLRQ
ncbi:conserved membrane hypothetical protein [Microbacterium sp. 8M]|uniref:hypothetical protein n=1 Tax=Microbacterium sp. 8M TaxID=2653153 RepID=UPI0012F2604F|nr:hypothetical protein [Microbacterium sp. 8M]VXB55656.1 conserved membrane hypothetical protein [Microbacterium sp. 8M]